MNHRVFLPIAALILAIQIVPTTAAPSPRRTQFRDPSGRGAYLVESNATGRFAVGQGKNSWLKGRSEKHPDQEVEISSRIVVRLRPGNDLQKVIAGTGLQLLQTVGNDTFILQTEDAWKAVDAAELLGTRAEVAACTPIMRQLGLRPHSALALQPNDFYFTNEFHLEQRDTNGVALGADINVRSAWSITRGEGTIIGIADEAVAVDHPDLASRAASDLHYNFVTGDTNLEVSASDTHATPVAGLAVADFNNEIGVAGVAPRAHFASWRIFSTNGGVVAADQLMNMFQTESNVVAVQNHSWGSTTLSLFPRDMLSDIGIANAIQNGRDGKGVIMVRPAGNFRTKSFSGALYADFNGNANDDGYNADPRVIVVGAVRSTGRVTYYSNPGACILVAAPATESSADDTGSSSTYYPGLITTLASGDYGIFGPGTSGSTPVVAGIASLIVPANTNLTYRDVQQILVLAAHHADFGDPDVRANGAGLFVSHNVGFGIPDAGEAVRLARSWSNRPPLSKITFTDETQKAVPDQGFLVQISGTDIPTNLASIYGLMASEGRHPDLPPGEMTRPDSPTATLPLVNVGPATNTITDNLFGKGALIVRGGDSFYNKIKRAEDAGASFAIIYNNPSNGDSLGAWSITNFVNIPAILIGETAGTNLASLIETNTSLTAQIRIDPATYTFTVTNQLSLEHVGLWVRTDNLRRSDYRITLTSPQGTRSILQRVNKDPSTNAPIDWTYVTTHDFFESSVGTWTVQISDEVAGGATGLVQMVELQLYGVQITDTDGDGLDDNWEMNNFGSLASGPTDDPDGDGYNNAREQVMGTNPNVKELKIENSTFAAGREGASYSELLSASGGPYSEYRWSLAPGSDPLPAGLGLSWDELHGRIAGVPTTNGTFQITIRATDANSNHVDETFTLNIIAASAHLRGRVINAAGNAITNAQITGTDGADGSCVATTDSTGSFVLAVNAGIWTLRFDQGFVQGLGLVPLEFTTTVSDGVDQSDILLQLERSTALISGTVTNVYGQPLSGIGVFASATIGSTNYTTSSATDDSGWFHLAVINGTWSVGLNGDDLTGNGYQTVTNRIVSVPPTNQVIRFAPQTIVPEIRTASLPGGTVGLLYAAQMRAVGGAAPYTWSVESGSLPPGLTLSSSGSLAGTPRTPGTFNFTINVGDVFGYGTSQSYSVRIVAKAPAIFTQPASQTVLVGAPVTFTVGAAGVAPLYYQWRFNGAPIYGATRTSYAITKTVAAHQGSYSVLISNSLGAVASANAVLRLNFPAAITVQPASKVVYLGTNATFSVTTSGTTPLYYQWLWNGEPIDSATNRSLTVAGSFENAGNYAVVVSNAFRSVTSSNAVLTVNEPAEIVTGPESLAVRTGSSVSFSVEATGTALHYQWRFNGTNLVGQTTSSLGLSNVRPPQSGTYSAVVWNGGRIVSASAQLKVYNCGYSLSTNLMVVDFNDASYSLGIASSNDCPWTAWSTNSWITVETTNGIGDGEIALTMEYNPTNGPRTGFITAGGKTCKVIQMGTLPPIANPGIAGKTLVMTVSQATGNFATNGSFLLICHRMDNSYRIVPLTGPTAAQTGSFSYIPSGIYGIMTLDALNLTLQFETASRGVYDLTGGGDNVQSGSFVIMDTKPDFNRDDWPDLVLQNTNGAVSVWLMTNGTNFVASAPEPYRISPALRLMALHDFDHDTGTDLLWQHTNGNVVIWRMAMTNVQSSVVIRTGMPAEWHIAGVADLNSDLKGDILWQHNDGRLAAWYMNGTNIQSSVSLKAGPSVASGWRIAGLNDFDGDGQVDILWQSSTGALVVWKMIGTELMATIWLNDAVPLSGLRVVGISDFDFDGQRDLLLQAADGSLQILYLNGTTVLTNVPMPSLPKVPAGWRIVGPK